MTHLIFLGTSNAIPDEQHENTHLIVVGDKTRLLIDCVGNPLLRLRQAGIDMLDVTDLLLTHFHPDHVSAVPSLLMQSWLLGRSAPLRLYGLAHTLDRIEKIMQFYDWESWPNFYPVELHRLPEDEMAAVFENKEMHVFASPVHHLVPAIGLRIEFPASGRTLAYSCDTEPCSEVVRLAQRVDFLIHEATGAMYGHSSAAQAGAIAAQAQAETLYLVHYNPKTPSDLLISQARETYKGQVTLATDLMHIDL
ncbi:MAG: ribonuclease Z [Chloroflexota bacterium]